MIQGYKNHKWSLIKPRNVYEIISLLVEVSLLISHHCLKHCFTHLFSFKFQLLPFVVTFPVIYMITSIWGLRAAVLSILLWTFGLGYFFFHPLNNFFVDDFNENMNLIIFCFSSLVISFYVDKKRQSEIRQNLEIVNMTAQELESKARALVLENESRLKDQFVSTLSHDLRTPLSISTMATQMILRRPEDVDQVTLLCKKSLVSLKRIDMMIQDLLDSRRVAAGNELNLELKEFDLMTLLKNLKGDFIYMEIALF